MSGDFVLNARKVTLVNRCSSPYRRILEPSRHRHRQGALLGALNAVDRPRLEHLTVRVAWPRVREALLGHLRLRPVRGARIQGQSRPAVAASVAKS